MLCRGIGLVVVEWQEGWDDRLPGEVRHVEGGTGQPQGEGFRGRDKDGAVVVADKGPVGRHGVVAAVMLEALGTEASATLASETLPRLHDV